MVPQTITSTTEKGEEPWSSIYGQSAPQEPLSNEQYLESLRQRIVHRVLEWIDAKEREKARLQADLERSKLSRFWRALKSQLLRWADVSLRGGAFLLRVIRAVTRTETSRPLNEKNEDGGSTRMTDDNERRVEESATTRRQAEKFPTERSDHLEGVKNNVEKERKLSIIREKEVHRQADGMFSDREANENTLSMVNKSNFSQNSHSNLDDEKARGGLKNLGPKKRRKRRSRHRIRPTDTFDQISSSMFSSDSDTDVGDKIIAPRVRRKVVEPKSRPRIHREIEEILPRRPPKQTDSRSPKKFVIKKPNVDLNDRRKAQENKKIEDVPNPVRQKKRELIKEPTIGNTEGLINQPFSRHRSVRIRKVQDSESSVNSPPQSVGAMPYPNIFQPPAIVENSLDETDDDDAKSTK